jgi:ABC-type Fe3+/spermidine/putrescine transport system ATPase subunit
MDHGLLRQFGTPREVYDRPANTFVAGFMGSTNLLQAAVKEQSKGTVTVEIEGGVLLRISDTGPFTAGERVIVSARPETLELLPTAASGALWPGEVTFATFVGNEIIYRVRVGPHTLDVRGSANDVHDIGSAVGIKPDGNRCRLLRS